MADSLHSQPVTPQQSISVWHYSIEGSQAGPIPEDELKALAKNGQLRRSDKVWKDGMSGWMAAGGIPGLFPSAPQPSQGGPPPLHQTGLSPQPPQFQSVRTFGGTALQTPDQIRSMINLLQVLYYVLFGLSMLVIMLQVMGMGRTPASVFLWMVLLGSAIGCRLYRTSLVNRLNRLPSARNEPLI